MNSLPDELISLICSYLPVHSRCRVRRVCRRIHFALTDRQLWLESVQSVTRVIPRDELRFAVGDLMRIVAMLDYLQQLSYNDTSFVGVHTGAAVEDGSPIFDLLDCLSTGKIAMSQSFFIDKGKRGCVVSIDPIAFCFPHFIDGYLEIIVDVRSHVRVKKRGPIEQVLSRYVIRPVLPSEIIDHPAKFPHRPGFLGGLRTRLFTKFDHISEFPQALQKEVPAAVSAARAQRLFTCNLCVAAPTAMGADLPAHGQHAGQFADRRVLIGDRTPRAGTAYTGFTEAWIVNLTADR